MDVVRIDDPEELGSKRLISVEHPVTSLALSYTSASLLVGTATGSIHIYDIASHQLLRSISTHKGLPITYIQAMLKPPDLIGHVSLTINVRSPVKDTTPPRPVVPFQRVRDAKVRESHEVLMVLPGHLNDYRDPTEYDEEEFRRDYDNMMQGLSEGDRTSSTPISQSRVTELESEVLRLQEQLSRTKDINDKMWETLVQQGVISEAAGRANIGAIPVQQKQNGVKNIDSDMAS